MACPGCFLNGISLPIKPLICQLLVLWQRYVHYFYCSFSVKETFIWLHSWHCSHNQAGGRLHPNILKGFLLCMLHIFPHSCIWSRGLSAERGLEHIKSCCRVCFNQKHFPPNQNLTILFCCLN